MTDLEALDILNAYALLYSEEHGENWFDSPTPHANRVFELFDVLDPEEVWTDMPGPGAVHYDLKLGFKSSEDALAAFRAARPALAAKLFEENANV